jgi:hypothetical protein
MKDLELIQGDARHLPLADESVQCISGVVSCSIANFGIQTKLRMPSAQMNPASSRSVLYQCEFVMESTKSGELLGRNKVQLVGAYPERKDKWRAEVAKFLVSSTAICGKASVGPSLVLRRAFQTAKGYSRNLSFYGPSLPTPSGSDNLVFSHASEEFSGFPSEFRHQALQLGSQDAIVLIRVRCAYIQRNTEGGEIKRGDVRYSIH